MKFFDEYELKIGKGNGTCLDMSNGVYQDGTAPIYRDVDGSLWAMSGHSHCGKIVMVKGTCLDDLKISHEIQTNFCVGNADYAFSGIKYPEGIKARGSIWPFGLYICPNTHRFFCWFHNETGWNGRGTAYDAYGPCDEPKFDSDFRHVGLMHSDDEGRTWTFDRWVLTANTVAFTKMYNPADKVMVGQDEGIICLGSGDFCMYIEPDGDYIYIFYNMIKLDTKANSIKDAWQSCDAYVARCRKRIDGAMGDFVKYYDGAFCEAGNMGKESAVVKDAWHPRIVYSEKEKMYIMTSKPIVAGLKGQIDGVELIGAKVMQICTSNDLLHWSTPEIVYKDGKPWGNHYNAIVPNDDKNQPNILTDNKFSILNNHNGTNVIRYPVELVRRK